MVDRIATQGSQYIVDPVSGLSMAIGQLHALDQQSLGGTQNSVVTGGPTLLINGIGTGDRQREGFSDSAPTLGIPGDVPYQLFQANVVSNTAVASIGNVTITPAAMSGTFNGVPWSIQFGSTIVYDAGGANQEVITVTGVTATTFNATFTKTHLTGVLMLVDNLNRQRDASGEWYGITGAGAAVAVDYQDISGGPTGTNNFDLEAQVPGKGVATGTLTTATQGTAQVVFNSTPTGLRAGARLWLLGGTVELVYVAKTYVSGTTVPLQSNIVNTSHTSALWDVFAVNGPGLTGFYPNGVDIDGIALTDPVTNLHYQQRMAPGAPGAVLASSDGAKATYRYAVQGFSPVATPTAMLIIQGSATKTIRIKRIKVSGVATAAGNMPIQLARWSTAGTQGSAALTALTAGKHDVNDAAATAVVSTVGTANYTTQGTGSAVPIAADRVQLAAAGSGIGFSPLTFDFATRQDKALILRGTSDYIVISGNGGAVPTGGLLDFEIEQEEDNS